MGSLTRIGAIALGLLAVDVPSSAAERRKNSLRGDRFTGSVSADHEGRLMVGLGASVGRSAGIDKQVRYFLHDRVAVGVRQDMGLTRETTFAMHVDVALRVGAFGLLGRQARTDVISTIGVGVAMTPPVIVGLAFRIHPRTQSTLVNAVVVEIGARMTDTLGTHAAEATVAALVMSQPVKYRRSCFGGKWH